MSRIFGTDGVRGVANADLTPELAFALGRAGAAVLASDAARERPIVVGRDTRLSGTMLEAALVAGITSTGRDVATLGILPTPAVARIVIDTHAAAGVMISASHNPVGDNGIKFFGSDGTKLDDAREAAIEARLASDTAPRPTHDGVGIVRDGSALAERYLAALVRAGGDLSPLVIVVDAAYGAAYALGPRAFTALGAHVVAINAEADGARINVACGSTDLGGLRARVRELAATHDSRVVGVAFDGDADRALFVDEAGETVDGDRVMMILAAARKHAGAPGAQAVVGTVMSNLGLERALASDGIELIRAAVGDRYVLEMLRERGLRFGGEQSGHIIDLDRNTTGDGPMTAVVLFRHLVESGATLHDLASRLHTVPQVLVNVRSSRPELLESAPVLAAVAAARAELGAGGRILVRASGTEPYLRVMIEGDDDALVARLADGIAATIRAAGDAAELRV